MLNLIHIKQLVLSDGRPNWPSRGIEFAISNMSEARGLGPDTTLDRSESMARALKSTLTGQTNGPKGALHHDDQLEGRSRTIARPIFLRARCHLFPSPV